MCSTWKVHRGLGSSEEFWRWLIEKEIGHSGIKGLNGNHRTGRVKCVVGVEMLSGELPTGEVC